MTLTELEERMVELYEARGKGHVPHVLILNATDLKELLDSAPPLRVSPMTHWIETDVGLMELVRAKNKSQPAIFEAKGPGGTIEKIPFRP